MRRERWWWCWWEEVEDVDLKFEALDQEQEVFGVEGERM